MHQPADILIIAQSTAAVLDIRFLHRHRIAMLDTAHSLILQTRGDVFIKIRLHAFRAHRLFHLFKQHFIACHTACLNQRRLGLHILVCLLYTIPHSAHRMTNLQAHIPKRVEHGIRYTLQKNMRLGVIKQSIFTQKLNINITVRIQLGASVSTQCNNGNRRLFLKFAQGRKIKSSS